MDSDLIIDIARSSSNICGVKLTCGAVGKLTRITSATTSDEFQKTFPRKLAGSTFLTLGGFADFMFPTVLGSQAHGAIMGLGNIYPRALAHLFESSQALAVKGNATPQQLTDMAKLQGLASEADWAFVAVGIAGTKYYLEATQGYGGVCRLPILPLAKDKQAALLKDERVKRFMEVETELANKVNGH